VQFRVEVREDEGAKPRKRLTVGVLANRLPVATNPS
jgi:hypothetical protein